MTQAGPWIIFELAINLFQSFLYMFYIWKMLGQKARFPKKIPFLVCSFTQFIQLTAFNFITLFEGFGVFVSFACIFVAALIFLNGSIIKKLIVSCIPVILNGLISLLTIQLAVLISQSNSYALLNFVYPTRFYIVFVANTFLLICFLLAIKLSKQLFNIVNQKEWKYFSIITLICIVSLASLTIVLLAVEKTSLRIYVYISMTSVAVILFYIFSIIKSINQKHRIETENELLKQQFFLQIKNIENIKKQYDALRMLRHDFNNTLCVIRNLNKEGCREQIEEYISSHMKLTTPLASIITTQNDYINAIINAKFSEATESGIETVISIASSFNPKEFTDICNLLGNMFDNAIRACQNCERNSIIRLDISQNEDETVILMKNSLRSSVLFKNPTLETDKENKDLHGYGTKIIREIAERHHGFADFYEEDDLFCCSVTLYL